MDLCNFEWQADPNRPPFFDKQLTRAAWYKGARVFRFGAWHDLEPKTYYHVRFVKNDPKKSRIVGTRVR